MQRNNWEDVRRSLYRPLTISYYMKFYWSSFFPLVYTTKEAWGKQSLFPSKSVGWVTCCLAVQTALNSFQRHLSPTLRTVGSSMNTIYWKESSTVKTISSSLLFCCHMAHLCLCTQSKQRHRAATKGWNYFLRSFLCTNSPVQPSWTLTTVCCHEKPHGQ